MDVAYELAFNHEMADRAQEWSRTDSFRLDECRAYVRNLVRQGGPEPCDYHDLNTWLEEIHRAFRNGEVTSKDVDMLREEFDEAFSLETMQGFAYHKPHRYAGDYEIMDRIYRHYIAPSPWLANWDRFFQAHAAPKAVRIEWDIFTVCCAKSRREERLISRS